VFVFKKLKAVLVSLNKHSIIFFRGRQCSHGNSQ